MPNAALLFAAGFGTRMRPLTDDKPKPLVEVAGKPLLDHALDLCHHANLTKIVVNTHYHADQIDSHLAGSGIVTSHEHPDILETGGGLRQALPLLGPGPVFTVNTDAVWSSADPLSQLLKNWNPGIMDALLLCVPLQRTVGHEGKGDFSIAPNGALSRGGDFVYTGVQIINPVGIEKIKDKAFSLNLLWNEMAANGRLFGTEYQGHWADVGQPQSIPLAEEMLHHV